MNLDNLYLANETSKMLYESVVKNAPIFDYHCHLSAKEIDEDSPIKCVTKLMLGADHYKWRAMRFAGVSERFITGDASPLEKFIAWAGVCERLVGSPLQIWNAMELKKYFGISEALNRQSAARIYDQCQNRLDDGSFKPSQIIRHSNVKLICTTDDPADSLEYHLKIKQEGKLETEVLPTFRPDKALAVSNVQYFKYLENFVSSEGLSFDRSQDGLETIKKALISSMDRFSTAGCILADHSFESMPYPTPGLEDDTSKLFEKHRSGDLLSKDEIEQIRWDLICFLSSEYEKRNWIMQIHIGALRNVNPVQFEILGPDSGYDVVNDFTFADQLAHLLGTLEKNHGLPKTILYTLNPEANPVLSVLPHGFSKAGIAGRLQFGAAWWFNDHKVGIQNHFELLASQGMLADFIGMLTDSRSFLAYVRHDYFRRLLCQYLGEQYESGEFIGNMDTLMKIAEDISWRNIASYLSSASL